MNNNVTIKYELKTMHATESGKGAFGLSLVFQISEHPRIGYFGYKKLSFDRLNVFLTPTKRFWFRLARLGKV